MRRNENVYPPGIEDYFQAQIKFIFIVFIFILSNIPMFFESFASKDPKYDTVEFGENYIVIAFPSSDISF